MAKTKDARRLPSGKIEYRGETYPGFNKPKRNHTACAINDMQVRNL